MDTKKISEPTKELFKIAVNKQLSDAHVAGYVPMYTKIRMYYADAMLNAVIPWKKKATKTAPTFDCDFDEKKYADGVLFNQNGYGDVIPSPIGDLYVGIVSK